jgi:hypothetical protein
MTSPGVPQHVLCHLNDPHAIIFYIVGIALNFGGGGGDGCFNVMDEFLVPGVVI